MIYIYIYHKILVIFEYKTNSLYMGSVAKKSSFVVDF